MSTSPTAKKRGPVAQAIRILYLSFALGVGSFIVSAPISWRLTLAVYDSLETAPRWISLLLSLLITNIGALLVSPAVAWVAGLLLFSARPIVVGFSIALSRQVIVYAIDAVSGTSDFYDPVFQALQHLAVLGICTGLSTWAYRRGIRRSEEREAARRREAETSSALANMKFDVPAQPEAPSAASALTPADALAGAASVAPPDEAARPAPAGEAASETPPAAPETAPGKPAGEA